MFKLKRNARALRRALALALAGVVSASAGVAAGRGADGKFEKRVSSHFVLYQDVDIDHSHGLRGSRRFEQDVLDALERAYQRVDELLGLRAPRHITVVVHDPAVFDARFAGLFRFPAAGFYGGTVHVRGGVRLDQQLAGTLFHELVHASFDAEAPNLVLPAWLNEGSAEWFEARASGKRYLSPGQAAYMQRLASQGRLFSLAQLSAPSFGGFAPEAAGAAYLQSYAFVEFLARHHGERSLRDLLRELLRTGDLDRAVRRTYRADLGRLEQRFAADYAGAARR